MNFIKGIFYISRSLTNAKPLIQLHLTRNSEFETVRQIFRDEQSFTIVLTSDKRLTNRASGVLFRLKKIKTVGTA